MLLKTITPVIVNVQSSDMEYVDLKASMAKLKSEFYNEDPTINDSLNYSNASIDAVLERFKQTTSQKHRVENFITLNPPFKVVHTDVFSGLGIVPDNCIALVQHTVNGKKENIYITSDQEAYIVSDTGVTISVINSNKNQDAKHTATVGKFQPTPMRHYYYSQVNFSWVESTKVQIDNLRGSTMVLTLPHGTDPNTEYVHCEAMLDNKWKVVTHKSALECLKSGVPINVKPLTKEARDEMMHIGKAVIDEIGKKR